MGGKVKFYWQKIGVLISVVLLLAFSDIGYLIPYGSIIFIPVIVAAFFLGARSAAIIGFIVGLTSMWQSVVDSGGIFNAFFSPYRNGSVSGSFLVCVVTRTLYGFFIGLIFDVVKKFKFDNKLVVIVMSYIFQLFQTSIILLSTYYIFPNSNVQQNFAIEQIYSVRETLLASLAGVVMYVLLILLRSKKKADIEERIRHNEDADLTKRFQMEGFTVGLTVFLTNLVLINHLNNLNLLLINFDSETLTQQDVIYIGGVAQYIVGSLAISYIIGVMINFYRMCTTYKINDLRKDVMTGLYTKVYALEKGKQVVEENKDGYFMIIDVDGFKRVNDKMGHLVGDRVISNIAFCLQDYFADAGVVARFGGDEFSFITTEIENDEALIERIINFQNSISKIPIEQGVVTCSIGVAHFSDGNNFEEVYKKADDMLYYVKRTGKKGFRIYNQNKK